MEIKQLKKTIDGIEFIFHRMSVLKAAILDKKIITILSGSVGSVVKKGLDTDLDLESLISNLGDGLAKMPDEDYQDFLISLLSKVQAVVPGKGAFELSNEDALNTVFETKLITIYKVIIEVMKYNGFSVFGLAGAGGLEINQILSSANQKPAENATGNE